MRRHKSPVTREASDQAEAESPNRVQAATFNAADGSENVRAPHDFGMSQYHLAVIFVRECKDGRLSCQKGLGLRFIRIGPGEAKLLEGRSDMPYLTFGAAQSVSGGGWRRRVSPQPGMQN